MPTEYFGGRVIHCNGTVEYTYAESRTYVRRLCLEHIYRARSDDSRLCKGTDNRHGDAFYIDYMLYAYKNGHTSSECIYRDTYTFDGVYTRTIYTLGPIPPGRVRRYSI